MSSAAVREHALLAAPDARQVSMYTKQFPPPPPGALQAPSLRPREQPAPATKDRRFTARTTYQAKMSARTRTGATAAPGHTRLQRCQLECTRGCGQVLAHPQCPFMLPGLGD